MGDLGREKHEIPCPGCRRDIVFTYDDLKSDRELDCRRCDSSYELDRSEQSQFRSAMQKLESEMRDLERAKQELERAEERFQKEMNDLMEAMTLKIKR
tara:strand:+ start:43 stop:336 length:294 start_codon:yes stop_codon:yes gene_type:complete